VEESRSDARAEGKNKQRAAARVLALDPTDGRPHPSPASPLTHTQSAPPTAPQTEPRPPALESGDYPEYKPPSSGTGKPRVVVVGSGWGACSFIKALSPGAAAGMDLTVVSPRNYFLYTPLLPAVATGTVEDRSIVEPVRKVLAGKGAYFEAVVHEVDPAQKSIVCCFPADAGLDQACFKVPYDILVLAVGCVNNTFGVEGVAEHATFFKSIEDAARLRRHVSECFERAALPQTPPEEKAKLLSFVVCGGGPTGVEVAAELHDMIEDDLAKVREGRDGRGRRREARVRAAPCQRERERKTLTIPSLFFILSLKIYPDIVEYAKVRIIELSDHLLSTYDREISKYTDAQVRIDERRNKLRRGGRGKQRGEERGSHPPPPTPSTLSFCLLPPFLHNKHSSNVPASTSSSTPGSKPSGAAGGAWARSSWRTRTGASRRSRFRRASGRRASRCTPWSSSWRPACRPGRRPTSGRS